MVIAIELKFGIHRHLLALCGFDDAAQRKADALAFPLMLVFSTFIGTLLSEYSLKDVLISQGVRAGEIQGILQETKQDPGARE
jgi:hypothetical protein